METIDTKVIQYERFFIYRKLAFLRCYSHKFLFVAFLGIHIPLIGIIFYTLFNHSTSAASWQIVGFTLLLTLLATALTLYALHALLQPLTYTNQQLVAYLDDDTLPSLPVNFQDEVGVLMANMQHVIDKLQRLADEKKELTELLSHDLRSPVHQIQALIQLLPDFQQAEERHETVAIIDALCSKQLDLLNHVLQTLKKSSQQLSADQLDKVNLHAFLQHCIAAEQATLTHKAITVNIEQVPEQLFVYIDRTLFQQVIQNILLNAVKFSFSGQAVHVHTEIREQELQIHIKDEGIGFKPEIAAHLFDRFTEHGREGTQNEASTGLGLYLTRKIVERHAGKIYACSEGKNQGATFIIALTLWSQKDKQPDGLVYG